MNIFDTHCHFHPGQADIAEQLAAARAVGVTRILVAGTGPADSTHAAELAAREPGVLAAVGVHPSDAPGCDGDLALFRELLARPGVAAVGEIGLDYFHKTVPPDCQRAVFSRFLELALEWKLPAVIHCREAFDDVYPRLHEAAAGGLRFVMHSFAGTPEQVEKLLPLGARFGFSGMVTFGKADNVRAALAAVPLDRVLVETDSPYLAPMPHRGQRNQPAWVVEVLRRVAQEKGVTLEHAAAVTTANALRLFASDPV